MIIQTLSRAAVDRSTTCRFSYDKCCDISNPKIPSLKFPFPSIFIRISQSLANSLSTHRPPPFQVALGPSSSFQQKLHFYQIVINYYGKFKDLRSYRSGKGRSVPAALYSHDSTKYLSSSNHNPSQSSSWMSDEIYSKVFVMQMPIWFCKRGLRQYHSFIGHGRI